MSTFKVEIELGNEAMSDPEHVALALRQVAGKLDTGWYKGGEGFVRDMNGNVTGNYWIEDNS